MDYATHSGSSVTAIDKKLKVIIWEVFATTTTGLVFTNISSLHLRKIPIWNFTEMEHTKETFAKTWMKHGC